MPGDYTQANRPIRVDTDALPTDALLLHGFNGIEGVSQPFAFQLDLMSTDPYITHFSMLRAPVRVTLNLANDEQRFFHGICSRFAQGHQRDDLVFDRAEIVPWFWLLKLTRGSRIFQDKTVPEILEAVFKRHGQIASDDYELSLSRSYLQVNYCVQYRETDFDFVSRL